MGNRLSGAIEELEEHLAAQLDEVAETKKMINALSKRMGEEPRYPDVSVEQTGMVRPDQYYGRPLATAASEYLERRKRACKAEEILQGLLDGGFDFDALDWKEKDRLRLLSSSMAKNNTKFHRLPNGTFGLLAWYDQAAIKQKREDRKQNGSATDEPPAPEEGDKASA
jgi:hypothetical protein